MVLLYDLIAETTDIHTLVYNQHSTLYRFDMLDIMLVNCSSNVLLEAAVTFALASKQLL